MGWKSENIIYILARHYVKLLGIFSLYLVCVYWATEAVIKYLNEPSSTAIRYTYGENGKVPKLPLITYCDHEAKYLTILESECGLKLGKFSLSEVSYRSLIIQTVFKIPMKGTLGHTIFRKFC